MQDRDGHFLLGESAVYLDTFDLALEDKKHLNREVLWMTGQSQERALQSGWQAAQIKVG